MWMLEQALKENEELLKVERRLDRQIDLMIARVEIYKSMIHTLKLNDINERKVA